MSSLFFIITNIPSIAESPSGRDNLVAAIAGTVVVGVTILTVVMVIVCMLWIHRRKAKQGQYDTTPAVDVRYICVPVLFSTLQCCPMHHSSCCMC